MQISDADRDYVRIPGKNSHQRTRQDEGQDGTDRGHINSVAQGDSQGFADTGKFPRRGSALPGLGRRY